MGMFIKSTRPVKKEKSDGLLPPPTGGRQGGPSPSPPNRPGVGPQTLKQDPASSSQGSSSAPSPFISPRFLPKPEPHDEVTRNDKYPWPMQRQMPLDIKLPHPDAPYTEFTLKSVKTPEGSKVNVMRFGNGPKDVDLGGMNWGRPIKLNRNDARVIKMKDDKYQANLRAEKKAQDRIKLEEEYRARGEEPPPPPPEEEPKPKLGLGGKKKMDGKKRNFFKKKTRRVFVTSEDAWLLKQQESRHWYLEDSTKKHRYEGQLVGDVPADKLKIPEGQGDGQKRPPPTDTSVGQNLALFMMHPSEKTFQIIPINRTYAFRQKPNYLVMDPDEVDKEFQRRQKIKDPERWFNEHHKPSERRTMVDDDGREVTAPETGMRGFFQSLKNKPEEDKKQLGVIRSTAKDYESDSDGEGKGKKREELDQEGDYDEFDWDDEFQDDEEGEAMVDEHADSETQKETKERILRQIRGTRTGEVNSDEEDEGGAELSKSGKKLLRQLKKVDSAYSSDDEEKFFDPFAESSDDESDEEEKKKIDEAAAKEKEKDDKETEKKKTKEKAEQEKEKAEARARAKARAKGREKEKGKEKASEPRTYKRPTAFKPPPPKDATATPGSSAGGAAASTSAKPVPHKGKQPPASSRAGSPVPTPTGAQVLAKRATSPPAARNKPSNKPPVPPGAASPPGRAASPPPAGSGQAGRAASPPPRKTPAPAASVAKKAGPNTVASGSKGPTPSPAGSPSKKRKADTPAGEEAQDPKRRKAGPVAKPNAVASAGGPPTKVMPRPKAPAAAGKPANVKPPPPGPVTQIMPANPKKRKAEGLPAGAGVAKKKVVNPQEKVPWDLSTVWEFIKASGTEGRTPTDLATHFMIAKEEKTAFFLVVRRVARKDGNAGKVVARPRILAPHEVKGAPTPAETEAEG